MAPAGPGVYVWGTQLPLQTMGGGREYALKLKVAIPELDLERTTVLPVLIND